MMMTMLTVRDHMTLTLAGATYRHEAIRTTHARELLGYSETRFHARKDWLLDQPAAASHPDVPRLRRLREARRLIRQK